MAGIELLKRMGPLSAQALMENRGAGAAARTMLRLLPPLVISAGGGIGVEAIARVLSDEGG